MIDINTKYDFIKIENMLYKMDEFHSYSDLQAFNKELNKFFKEIPCKKVLYTVNTDKMFFGMRVYVILSNADVASIVGDETTPTPQGYYLELDSKLFDPMLGLDRKELTAILLHEIGHIVYDNSTIEEMRKNLDVYFVDSETSFNYKTISSTYNNLLAYAMKDSIMKIGSIFSKIGDDEIIADSFVVSCGYGPDLESAFKKISTSNYYLGKQTDNRLLTLSWVIRLATEFNIKRLPAIHTLNRAKSMTGSQLEKNEIDFALTNIRKMQNPLEEGALDDIKDRFSNKINKMKIKGIRIIKDDVYEMNVRLRCAESEEDLLFIIRNANTDISILQDYLSEPDITDIERKSCTDALQQLYDIRQRAAKEQKVHDRYSSFIQVVYPE